MKISIRSTRDKTIWFGGRNNQFDIYRHAAAGEYILHKVDV